MLPGNIPGDTRGRSRGRVRAVALVTAPLVTALVVGVGILTGASSAPDAPSAGAGSASILAGARSLIPEARAERSADARTLGTSRSSQRVPLVDNRVPRASGRLWTTADLKLRIEPREKSRVAGLLESDRRIEVTGRERRAYAEVITGRVTRWVTAKYLSRTKPKKQPQPRSQPQSQPQSQPASPSMGVVDRPCTGVQGTESGLTSSAVRVYRTVCNNFPQITTYGGYAPRGEHGGGKAIDIMTPDPEVGTRLAEFLKANAATFDLYAVLWRQRIWTPQRSSEGWRSMEDRGSPTANHMDHVHVAVN